MAAASSAVATPGAQRTPTAAGRDPTFAAPHANATRAKAAARMAAAKTARKMYLEEEYLLTYLLPCYLTHVAHHYRIYTVP